MSSSECRGTEGGRGPTLSVEAMWHAPYELAVGLTGGSLDLLARCFRVAIRDVRRNGPTKKNRILNGVRAVLCHAMRVSVLGEPHR